MLYARAVRVPTQPAAPAKVLDLSCKCGKGSKCPTLQRTTDGFVVSEPETGDVVRFTDEQMAMAIEWARSHLAAEAAE